VKFLLWQFAAYALAAFLLGLAMAYLWSRPQAARLSRKLRSQSAHVVALQSEIVALQAAAQRDRNIVAAIAPLTEQLSVARGALTLVEAELEASALNHAMLTSKTVDLSERAARHEILAGEAERAQSEALRTRIALDSAIAEHVASRAVADQALADALARAQSAESSLANLRRTHERLVVDSRRELTELAMRAERAERDNVRAVSVTSAVPDPDWQSAMAEAATVPADDQILIVLPNEVAETSSIAPTVKDGSLANDLQSDSPELSQEREHSGMATMVETPTSSTPLLIELRRSE
jgi:chromosome segregation ATPase